MGYSMDVIMKCCMGCGVGMNPSREYSTGMNRDMRKGTGSVIGTGIDSGSLTLTDVETVPVSVNAVGSVDLAGSVYASGFETVVIFVVISVAGSAKVADCGAGSANGAGCVANADGSVRADSSVTGIG